MKKIKSVILIAAVLLLASCVNRPRLTKAEVIDYDITTSASLSHETEKLCGGYSEVREPDMDEYQFFRDVTDTIKGMTFTPLTVQTQVVAGINYKFYCRYSDVTEEDNPGHCYLTIFKPLPGQGEPTITSIEKINTTHHNAITNPMKEADLSVLGAENQFDLIGRQWMLITTEYNEKEETIYTVSEEHQCGFLVHLQCHLCNQCE